MSGLRLEVGAVFLLQMGTNCSDVARPFVARIEDFCIPPMTLGRSVSGPKPSAQVFKKLKILVSAVRFRPWPPNLKPRISNDPGLFSLQPRNVRDGLWVIKSRADCACLCLISKRFSSSSLCWYTQPAFHLIAPACCR